MNKIYRRLWSTARQCWVVASELSAARGRSSQVVRAGALSLALTLAPAGAWAGEGESGSTPEEVQENRVLQDWALQAAFGGRIATHDAAAGSFAGVLADAVVRQVALTTDSSYRDSTVSGNHLVVLGSRSTLSGSQSVAYGNLISSRGTNNTAIGYNVQITNGDHATGVGANAVANGIGTTALGNDAKAYTQNSIAVGSGAATHGGAGISKIAIGGDAFAGTGGWTGAIALGGRSRAEYDGVAIGYEASTSANGTVALGRGSVASEANTVSVGNAGTKRRIVNVADGNVNATSTDVVNGRQLNAVRTDARNALTTANTAKATADRALAASGLVSQTSASSAIRVGGENTGTVLDLRNRSNANRKISGVADAALSTTSTEAVTGKQLHATNQTISTVTSTANAAKAAADAAAARIAAAALALGQSALAEGSGGTASAALGSAAKAYNSSGVALGADARAGVNDKGEKSTGNGAVAIGALSRSGNGAVAAGLRASAIGDRAVALGSDANAAAIHSTAMGYKASASANQATALGREASASGSYATALGNLASARAESAVALGDRAVAAHAGSVALGNGSQTTAANQISVGNGTLKRKIVNLADGALSTSSTEAVTGKQLNATNVEVASVRTTAISAQTTADSALSKADVLGGLVSQASATGNVRLGGENTGTVLDVRNKANANRTLSGVADATLSATSTEAVTGKQLNATNVEVASVRSTATGAQATADSALAKARATGNLVATAAEVSDANKATATGNLAMAMGSLAKANGVASVALGNNANAVGTNAISVGSASGATAQFAVALGGNAKATHENAVALGEKSVTSGTNQVSVGNASLKRKLVNVADATLSSTSTDAVTGKQVFAIDQKVTANGNLLSSHAAQISGHGTRIADNRRDLDALRTEFDDLDPDLEGVVRYAADGSIDMDGGKVRGVAAGDIGSAASTDAVNGGQLFSTNQRISAIESAGRFMSVFSDADSEAAEVGRFGVAIGDGARASLGKEGGTAVGSFTSADAKDSVALGRGANVGPLADQGFALGVGTNVYAIDGVALGAYARVEAGATSSVALGAGSIADTAGTVSLGHASLQRRLVNVGRGTADTDATTIAQLSESLAKLGGGAGVDASGNVVAPTYRMQGGTQSTVADALAVLDGAVITNSTRVAHVEHQLRSVFQDAPTPRGDGLNQLNLAGPNGMVLGNVATGLIAPGSRDAVNGGQLYAAEQKIERNRNDLDELLRGPSGAAAFSEAEISGSVDFGGARLVGVAEGRLEESSTDVVNGSQLFATNSRLNAVEDASRYVAVGEGIASDVAESSWFGVAVGAGAVASPGSEGGTAIGSYTSALSINSVAVGRGALVTKDAQLGIAIGGASESDQRFGVALGPYAKVRSGAVNSVALGSYSEALEQNVLSVGNLTLKRRIVNVANGRNANDAATVGQLRGALATLGSDVDANGNIVGPTFNVQGGSQHTLGDALNALDGAVITAGSRVDQVESQLRSVFQDSPATRSDGLGQLNLAGPNGMVLGNVANGLIAPGSRDAVNGGQLHAMEQRLDGRMDGLEQRVGAPPEGRALASASAPTPPAATEGEGPAGASGDPAAASAGRAGGGIASADGGGTPAPADAPAPTPQVDTAELEKMLARANEYTDGAISTFERRLDKMDKRFNRMAAMSSAQTAMAMNTAGLATYNRLGAGVGYSDGESAMAVGYQRVLNERGSATFSLNGAFTNSGEQSVGLGVGIGW